MSQIGGNYRSRFTARNQFHFAVKSKKLVRFSLVFCLLSIDIVQLAKRQRKDGIRQFPCFFDRKQGAVLRSFDFAVSSISAQVVFNRHHETEVTMV